jgi:radical SAM protein with 4Fe4S-binding SPASM domain
MTDEVAEKAIEFAATWGKEDLRYCWYGGEPLLAFDMIKKWTPKMKEGFPERKVSITTNGSLMDEAVRDFADEHDVGILFSIDGPPWIHNRTRVFAGGKPSWEKIPVKEIIEWRPDIEIAWQLSPDNIPAPSDLEWMMDFGFHNINFNINWLMEWNLEQQQRLIEFIYHAMRLAVNSYKGGTPKFASNIFGKIQKLVNKGGERDAKPCGTSLGMLAVTPEGYLYPSQEMGFLAFEPDRASGTDEFYRVGNVLDDPVLAPKSKLDRIFALKNDEMVPPPGRNCDTCPARSISFGGCHCRYIGQDGEDPSNRYDVLPGWCQSTNAVATAGLLAFAREGFLNLKEDGKSRPRQKQPLSIVDLDMKLDKVLAKLEEK